METILIDKKTVNRVNSKYECEYEDCKSLLGTEPVAVECYCGFKYTINLCKMHKDSLIKYPSILLRFFDDKGIHNIKGH